MNFLPVKSVLISIRPYWCRFIESGLKTVELRKSCPKNIEPPFKCYIYETLGEKIKLSSSDKGTVNRGCGKVVGEFVCDEIKHFTQSFFEERVERDTEEIAELLQLTCLTYKELCSYVGLKDFYGWHISNLVIYDKPKELSDFSVFCKSYNDGYQCDDCEYFINGIGYDFDESDCGCNGRKPIERPPQSWCYVETRFLSELRDCIFC